MAPLLARLGLGRSGFGFGKRTVSGAVPFSATGGTVVDSGGYRIHIFTGPSIPGFDITSLGTGVVEVLVVAGGGGGGSAGGGAGGLVNTPHTFTTTGAYPITIGVGGNSGRDGPGVSLGTNGGESWIGPAGAKIKPASGGGAGGITDGPPTIGNPGGSGGGAGVAGPGLQPGGAGTPGQGYPGGGAYPYAGGDSASAGGGGAGGTGTSGEPPALNPQSAGPGGIGLPISWIPPSYGTPGPNPGRYFSGGGGGGSWGNPAGLGGSGGGGVGGSPTSPGSITGTSGTINTGGGGGGSGYPPWGEAGTGGSGIIAIRYLL